MSAMAAPVLEEIRPVVDAFTEALEEREKIAREPEAILTLGIETSCDETSVAILKGEREILSNVIASSSRLHEKYGGIVPEIASRAHVQALNPALAEAVERADTTLWDVSVIAVTAGPGLVGSLVVGVAAAKALSAVLEIPLIGVNHLEAHIYSNLLAHEKASLPSMNLIVSGGHTMLVHAHDHGIYEVVGRTLDDAAGEAFDKVARFLDLGFPGGPAIDKLAAKGDPAAIDFPRALLGEGYDFSFSGLKTAVMHYVRNEEAKDHKVKIEDVCASFQKAIVDVQVAKTVAAAVEFGVSNVFLSGGVAANSQLRSDLERGCEQAEISLYYPPVELCTDNAAMVACCGFHRYRRGIRTTLDIAPDPNLPLG